jgi:molecular chaperone GrpE
MEVKKETAREHKTEDKFEELKKIKEEKLKKEKKRKDEKEAKISELTEALQRLQAEFENYKKRTENEKEGFIKYAKADLIVKMLPILDSLELALKNTTDKEKFVKGVELIFAQLYSLLEAEGVRPIKAVGEKFDPYKHEVLMREESDKKEEIVLEEFQRGYMLYDRVLRPSKVKVSRKKSR